MRPRSKAPWTRQGPPIFRQMRKPRPPNSLPTLKVITQGCNALIILAQDSASIGPALDAAADAGVPVVGYDRMIDDPRAFYLTFDNVEVGRMQARAVLEAMPKGRYVMIKGSPVDPNADFLRGGQQEVLQPAIDAGDVTIVAEAYTEDWQPANAQRNMEQILTEADNGVDAVVASNGRCCTTLSA